MSFFPFDKAHRQLADRRKWARNWCFQMIYGPSFALACMGFGRAASSFLWELSLHGAERHNSKPPDGGLVSQSSNGPEEEEEEGKSQAALASKRERERQ